MPPDVREREGHNIGEESQAQAEELQAQQEAAVQDIIAELKRELYYSCFKFLSRTIQLYFIIRIGINEILSDDFLRVYFLEVACVYSAAFYMLPLLLAWTLSEELSITFYGL